MSCPPIPAPVTGPLVLLNAPVVTNEGRYCYEAITAAAAREIIGCVGFDSAVGHVQTAKIISRILDIDCPMRRVEFRQVPGQTALVFRLGRRLEEGRILESVAEIEEIGYSFALLTRES